jgi:hypothetical protein
MQARDKPSNLLLQKVGSSIRCSRAARWRHGARLGVLGGLVQGHAGRRQGRQALEDVIVAHVRQLDELSLRARRLRRAERRRDAPRKRVQARLRGRGVARARGARVHERRDRGLQARARAEQHRDGRALLRARTMSEARACPARATLVCTGRRALRDADGRHALSAQACKLICLEGPPPWTFPHCASRGRTCSAGADGTAHGSLCR